MQGEFKPLVLPSTTPAPTTCGMRTERTRTFANFSPSAFVVSTTYIRGIRGNRGARCVKRY